MSEQAAAIADPSPGAGTGPGRIDAAIAWLLGWPAAVALATWCVLCFLVWLPSYLSLPLFTDHDHFAMLAQDWDTGVRPYAEHKTNQFPGEIYWFWAHGKLFGWGDARSFYAIDALLLAGFLLLLVGWSVREWGRALYGWIGAAGFLAYYLSQNYTITGQREWHVVVLLAIAFLSPRLQRGQAGWVASALAFGLAMLFRPQAILTLPGLLLTLCGLELAPSGAEDAGRRGRLLRWCAFAAIPLVLGFLPLLLQGVLDDFVREFYATRLGIARGFDTGSAWRQRFLTQRLLASRHPGYYLAPLALLLLSVREPAGRRSFLAGLALGALGAWFYQVTSPVAHEYYELPMRGMLALNAVALGGVLDRRLARTDLALLATVALLLATEWAPRPTHIALVAARRGLASLRDGRPVAIPPRAFVDFPDYEWADLEAAIAHVRATTAPTTRVASLNHSKRAIVSAIPRPAAVPVDYLMLVLTEGRNQELVASALRQSQDAVVLWNPTVEKAERPWLADLFAVVESEYALDRAFGLIEVWRRRGSEPSPAPDSEDARAPLGPSGVVAPAGESTSPH